MADFTVVIPAYNEGSQVLRTMRALGASFDGSYTPEVVVVDDHSTDNTHELAQVGARELKATGLSAVVVRASRRSGLAGAKNIGQAHATTPVTFFLDAHSVPGRGSIERVIEPLLNKEAAIAGPTFVALPETTQTEKLDGRFEDVPPDLYELPNIVERVDATGAGYGRGMVFRDHSMLLDWMTFRVADRGLQRVMIVPGGCCGVRTDEHGPNVFDGLFDTGFSFPWGAEDAAAEPACLETGARRGFGAGSVRCDGVPVVVPVRDGGGWPHVQRAEALGNLLFAGRVQPDGQTLHR